MSFFLLCCCRDTEYPYNTGPPLGILSLGTYLEMHGADIKYYVAGIHSPRYFRELLEEKPVAVGFSVMGGFQIISSLDYSRYVKQKYPRIPVIWGGFFPSMLPVEVLESGLVDCVVQGEGEESALELLKQLKEGYRFSSYAIPGTIIRDSDGSIIKGEKRRPIDLQSLPFPYQGKALSVLEGFRKAISRRSREKVKIEFSRGCTGRCQFCFNRMDWVRNFGLPGFSQINSHLKRLRLLGIDEIDIVDDTLAGGNTRLIEEILPLLGSHMRGWQANMRLDLITEEIAWDMEASGCNWLFFGVESLDENILSKIDKELNVSTIEESIGYLNQVSIPATYSIISFPPSLLDKAGSPIKDPADPLSIINTAERIHFMHPGAEIQIQSFVPLPGTPLWKRALEIGYSPPEKLSDWSRWNHINIFSPFCDDRDLPSKLYISSFFAYRGSRYIQSSLHRALILPIEKLSEYRMKKRWMNYFVESQILKAAAGAGRLRHSLENLSLHLFS